MLKDYVEAVTRRIISEKAERGISPLCATKQEIDTELQVDLMECMRALHREGKFRGSKNVNGIPMLLPIDS